MTIWTSDREEKHHQIKYKSDNGLKFLALSSFEWLLHYIHKTSIYYFWKIYQIWKLTEVLEFSGKQKAVSFPLINVYIYEFMQYSHRKGLLQH